MELYQKYIPRTFDDFIGQPFVVRELKARLAEDRVATVNFFIGASGTGKTSMGYLLAAYTNCSSRSSSSPPCGECAACKEVWEGRGLNVHCFDGSAMDKTDVVELEDLASTPPMGVRRRFIIVDEFQQLSSAAKGAMLKLLERKRQGLHFVLCSMDAGIDKAILSRGVVYRFNALDQERLLSVMTRVMEAEGVEVEEGMVEVLLAIAQNAGGNLRLALELLDRVLMSGVRTESELFEATGIRGEESSYGILLGLLSKDTARIDGFCEDIASNFWYVYKVLASSRYVASRGDISDWRYKSSVEAVKNPNFGRLWVIFNKVYESNTYRLNTNLMEYLLGEYLQKERF